MREAARFWKPYYFNNYLILLNYLLITSATCTDDIVEVSEEVVARAAAHRGPGLAHLKQEAVKIFIFV